MLQDDDFDSDTSDEDFVPEGVVESDDAVSDGEEEEDEAGEGDDATLKGKKKKQRKKGIKKKSNGVEKEEEDESIQEEVQEKNKKKEESIWADFLADVEDKPSPPPKPKASSWGALLGNKKPSSKSSTDTTPAKPPPPVKKESSRESSSKQEKVKITQVFEFAGEEVRVEKEVDAESAEAQAAKCRDSLASQSSSTSTKAPPGVGGMKRAGGLSGLVSLLDSKKPKLSTLEKTKLDWSSFKSDEGIESELEKHKKSKDGYLDKQAFLERADLRQFEIERSMRMSKRSNR